jgi:hypothetical protein
MSSILCVTERKHCVSATSFCVRHPVCRYAQRHQATALSPHFDFFDPAITANKRSGASYGAVVVVVDVVEVEVVDVVLGLVVVVVVVFFGLVGAERAAFNLSPGTGCDTR